MNFTILVALIITVLGLYFRILPYDNIQGLWNDEYVGWYISQQPFVLPFIKGILAQCHMPLYYIFLKIYTSIFGNSDVVLRLSSFITGFLSIIVMFFVGNQKNRILGYLCALFTAISGFLVYYSYEVRPYSLIFLLSALSLLYTIKLLGDDNKKNLSLYITFNILILLTHTLGFIYVLTNMFIVAYYIKDKNLKYTRNIFFSIGLLFLLLTPVFIKIFTTVSFSQWWGVSSLSKLAFMFTDIYSNYLVNFINAPANFFSAIGWGFFILGIIPTVICLVGLINSLFIEKEYTKSLFIMVLVPTAILTLVSFTSKFVFLTKYNIEVYPILIFLALYGLFAINKKTLKIGFLVILFVLNTSMLFTKNFQEYFYKPESNKLVADLLNHAQLKPNDVILFTYYPRERFSKYFDYSEYEVREVHKGNFFYYLTPNTTYEQAVIGGKEIYKPIFMSNKNPQFSSAIESEFYQNLKSGRKIAVVFLNSVSMLSDVQIYTIASDDNFYSKTPQPYLIFSYVKNFLIKKMYEDLKMTRYEQNGNWSMVVFEKP